MEGAKERRRGGEEKEQRMKKKRGRKEKKRNKKEKKAYTTSSSLSSSTDEANLCLMADHDDAESISSTDKENDSQVSLDIHELINAFNEMHQEAQKLAISNKKLKSIVKY